VGLASANFYRWSSPRESVRHHAIASRVIVVDLAELAFIDSTAFEPCSSPAATRGRRGRR